MTTAGETSYRDLLERGAALYPGVRIGRPGRSRAYWPTIAAMRALRLRWSVHVEGSAEVAPGAAILIGNHSSAMDPVLAVMSHWWRVTAFAKVEVFERRGAIFFRLMGQIPLRRGDEQSTGWALDMAKQTLADGNKVGLYPEGTRSPDARILHRLHQRVMIPLLQACPDVPVHAISTTYPPAARGRRRADIRLSPPLAIDVESMTPDEVTAVVRAAILALSGQTYVDESAAKAKRRVVDEQA